MKITLTVRSAQETAAEYGSTGQRQESTLTLEGTPAEVNAALDELFDEFQASLLRHELGLKAQEASPAPLGGGGLK